MDVLEKHGIRRTILKNGLKVMVKRISSEFVYAAVVVKCGSIYERRSNCGISHLLEHLMYAGGGARNARRSKRSYKIERLGGGYDPEIGIKLTKYVLKAAKTNWARDFRLCLDNLADFRFTARELAQEKQVVFDEIRRDGDGFEDAVRIRLSSKNSLSWPIDGKWQAVRSITSKMIKGWHRRFYRPDRMLIVAAGDITLEKVVRIIKKSRLYKVENNPNVVIPEPVEPRINWNANAEINAVEENRTNLIFSSPRNPRNQFFLDYIGLLLDDTSIVSLRWEIERPFGLHEGIAMWDYMADLGYISVDITAPSQKILKKMEKKILRWIEKVKKDGLRYDKFLRAYTLCRDDIKENFNNPEWWMETLCAMAEEETLEEADNYLVPCNLGVKESKLETERVFREVFGGKYIIFRNLKTNE